MSKSPEILKQIERLEKMSLQMKEEFEEAEYIGIVNGALENAYLSIEEALVDLKNIGNEKMSDYNFPIEIIEMPKDANPRTWVIHNEDHLYKLISWADKYGYHEWAIDRGFVTFEEDGETFARDDDYTLEAYIAWLREGLVQLIIKQTNGAAIDWL